MKAPELASERFPQRRSVHIQMRRNEEKPLRVMKFGGTSLRDASCIERVVEIIRTAARESNVVVVVSAMSGVTNKLVEAATRLDSGSRGAVATILDGLSDQHNAAADGLIRSPSGRKRIRQKVRQLLQRGERLFRDANLTSVLRPRRRDAIISLGERLSAPLVAAALVDRGVDSEAVEATELVITDSAHGAATPDIGATRKRCEVYLRPLLRRGIVPVVTGFIGATSEGVLTTLGRNSSDYSATILAAALDANEVVLWTDVDGVLTADPRLVPSARSIPEISYCEAAALAYFGAKVLHPKALYPLTPHGIPLWIRNTFAADRPGTKIAPIRTNDRRLKGLAAFDGAALIRVGGPGIANAPDVLNRMLAAASGESNVTLVSQSSSQDEIGLVVSSTVAQQTIGALHREFVEGVPHEKVNRLVLDPAVAIVTAIGQDLRDRSQIIGRVFDALGRAGVNIISISQDPSEESVSFIVAQEDLRTALVTMHQEFQLDTLNAALPSGSPMRATTGMNQASVD
jgi:bifunctional aspartokinase / homoserine dehydrogenase 1